MTDKLLADEMDSYAYYLTDSTQRQDMTIFAAQARALEAELKQCLTAHAMLNDKVCALDTKTLCIQAAISGREIALNTAIKERDKLKAENEALKDKAAVNTLAFNISLKEIKKLKSNLESARLLCTETADEICRLEDQLEDCTAVNLENMKKIARQETALDEIIKAPGGGPGKRIATQARRG